jgi:hypothetical protein
MKALKKCANGCDAAPQAPSKVLCKECLEKLDIQFRALAKHPDYSASGTGPDDSSPYSED